AMCVPGGTRVVIMDDDPFGVGGMGGLLGGGGYHVVPADTDGAALAAIADHEHPPDLIVSDYHLPGGKTGIEVIEALRRKLSAEIPAFLVSGDISPELLREVRATGHHLLHKPVEPMPLRDMASHVLKQLADAH